MKKHISTLGASLMLAVLFASGGHAQDAATKASQREQALAQLNDPDTLVRISVLEEILRSEDGALKTIAARKALSSTDGDLRTMALRYAFSQGDRQYTFNIEKCIAQQTSPYSCQGSNAFQAFHFYFVGMNKESGQFNAYSTISFYSQSGTTRIYKMMPGRVMSGVVDFEFQVDSFGAPCFVRLDKLEGTSLSGKVTCQNNSMSYVGRMELF